MDQMEKKEFQAESKRLLDLMINSIYTHKEIFLREILSNASDAIDKLAYQALTDDKVGLNRDDFAIRIQIDPDRRTITVSDNGIGMTKEEMEQNLGTIARSGSYQFKQDMEDSDAVDIIGQFGVGFYSAFMVSDAVTVVSRKYGSDESWMWNSQGADGYTMMPCEKETVGTDVVMKLKEDTEEEKYSDYLQEYTIRDLVRKYSDYLRYPIRMEVTKYRSVPDPEDEKKTKSESYREEETLNSMIPLWQKPQSEVTEEEYDGFYQDKFFDYQKPLTHISVSAEGAATYKSLLFVPSHAGADYYTKEYRRGLQLYSSGVMIMEHCEELIPDYFAFVRGVVDSQDLSLNISREMLQHDRQVQRIAQNLEKKVRQELEKIMKDRREDYEKFYAGFGLQLKYGVLQDYGAHQDTLKDLLLFWSAKEQKLISLKEYTEAMGEDQKVIYYASGDNRTRLQQLPQTEVLLSKGFDVLLFTEEVDEFAAQTMHAYAEKEFKNVVGEGADSSDENREEEQALQPALEFISKTLGDKVSKVRLSKDLGSHPVSMAPDGGMSFEMARYFQKLQPDAPLNVGKILELNADHPVFVKLQNYMGSNPEKAEKLAQLLYHQALLMAGLELEDPTAYTDLVCEMIS